jgi:hypothetical protein
MRDWTLQNPRINKTRLDSSWLLKYLRWKKYNIPAAQETLERHLVLRNGVYEKKMFHGENDITRPCIKKLIDSA